VSSAPEIRELKPRSLTGRERSLVEALRHFIDENHHPVAGVARRLGLSYITLRKVLDGEQVPQARTLQLIANYLRMEAVRTAFDPGMAKPETNEPYERCPFCRMALARNGGNKETQRPMSLLVERLSAIVETFAAGRMRNRERSFLAEAKEESLLSILTEMIEEDRLYAHDAESVAARIIEISQHFRLPCEIEETMSWAKSKLRSPRQTYADLLAQRVALRNRLAILRERESTES
jgi:hypothetical protein